METYFASAQRAEKEELLRQVDLATRNPVIDGLLKMASGLLAVLNEHRQILLLNSTFLEMLGLDDPQKALGLRPGEVIRCIHAHEMPGGCGTSKFCSTCGAAVAIVASLAGEEPVERKCVATVERNAGTTDLCLKVRSICIHYEGRRFILLFLQDITAIQRWTAIEHVFFHDISNLVAGLRGGLECLLLADQEDATDSIAMMHQASERLVQEMAMQKALLREELSDYQPIPRQVALEQIWRELRALFSNHPAAKGKLLVLLPPPVPSRLIRTDISMLLRVLANMTTNAFEATDEGGKVRFWVEEAEEEITFCVWSAKPIPADVAIRVFQRHFSTKQETGRGLGTYAMKLFGEQYLGGEVDFITSEDDGTVFRLCLPV